MTKDQLNTLEGIVRGAKNLPRSIASDVWPNGAILKCSSPSCDYAKRITTEEAGKYLASGWPKHCDGTMSCEKLAEGA